MSIRVIVAGFKGRMGSTAVEMVKGDDELTLAALLDPFATEKEVDGIPVFTDKADLVGFDADVWVDFLHWDKLPDNTVLNFPDPCGFELVVLCS